MKHSRTQINGIYFILALILIVFLNNLDITAVNLSIHSIAQNLNINLKLAQAISSIYLFTAAISFIPAAKFATKTNLATSFVLGTIIFMIASLFIALTNYVAIITMGRALQGVGMAMTLASTIPFIAEQFVPKLATKIIGFITAVIALSQLSGSYIAALVIQYLNWHYLFYLNIPICLVSIFLLLLLMKNSYIKTIFKIENASKILAFSLFPLLTAFLSLVGMSVFENYFFYFLISFALIFLVYISLVYFKKSQFKDGVFEERNFTIMLFNRTFFQFIYFGLIFTLPLYLQIVSNFSITHTSHYIFIMLVTFSLSSPFVGSFLKVISYKNLVLIGLFSLLVATSLFGSYFLLHSIILFIFGSLLFGISSAILFSTTFQSIVIFVKPGFRSNANGILLTLAFLAGSFSIMIGSATLSFFNISVRNKVAFKLVHHPLNTSLINHSMVIIFGSYMLLLLIAFILTWKTLAHR